MAFPSVKCRVAAKTSTVGIIALLLDFMLWFVLRAPRAGTAVPFRFKTYTRIVFDPLESIIIIMGFVMVYQVMTTFL